MCVVREDPHGRVPTSEQDAPFRSFIDRIAPVNEKE